MLASVSHIELGLIADVVVETRCELVAVIRPKYAIEVIDIPPGVINIWRGVEVHQGLAETGGISVRSKVIVQGWPSSAWEAFGNLDRPELPQERFGKTQELTKISLPLFEGRNHAEP